MNITVNIGDTSSQQCLRIRAGILSGPHDLDGSKVNRSFLTPSSEIATFSNGVMGSSEHSGILERFSLVKTD